MSMTKMIYVVVIALVAIASSVTTYEVTQQIQQQAVAIDDRKDFGFCPDIGSFVKTQKYINGQIVTYTTESCPAIRVYINNWTQISPSTQSIIINNMKNLGFVESVN